jgi:hypothetical protein
MQGIKISDKTIIEYTEGQRQARKIFQNYFTKCLYDKKRTININYNSEPINNAIKDSCKNIWENIINLYIGTSELNMEKTSKEIIVSERWSEYIRFFLKGGNSTIEYINNILLNTNENSQKRNIAKAFYTQFINSSNSSDYDFCFLIHPDCLKDAIRQQRKLGKILKEEKFNLRDKIKDDINKYIDYINSPYIQVLFLKRLVEESIKEFQPDEQIIFQDFLNKCDELTEPYFKFKLSNDIVKFIETKVKLPHDTFYLNRLVIPIEFEREYNLPTVKDKLFAECIDISFSIDKEVTENLWKKTDINNILRPLNGLDKIIDKGYSFPIIGLDYRLNDIVIILAENYPNKPEKRCKRFIEQLYFSCVEEKLPRLPDEIFIGISVYELMQTESDCKSLNEILTFEEKVKDAYRFTLNEQFKDITKFELWCRNTKFSDISLSWESMCNIDFVSKEELKLRVMSICDNEFNLKVNNEYMNSYSKSYLCYLYKHLLLISFILNIVDDHEFRFLSLFNDTWRIIGKNDIKEFIKNNSENDIRNKVKEVIQYYLKKHPLDNYFKGESIEKLIDYIKTSFVAYNYPQESNFVKVLNRFTLI